MDDKTYGALKRLVKEAKEYRKIINKDLPIIMGNDIQLVEGWIDEIMGNDIQLVEGWIDEVAKDYQ